MQSNYKNNKLLIIWLNLIHWFAYFLFKSFTYFQKNRRTLSYFTSKILPELDGDIVCPTIYNFSLCLNESGGHWIYYLGFYELGTIDVIKRCLKEGDVFIDVGSSIGLMTLTASKAVGDSGLVFSFEPDKKRFKNLLNSIEINNCKNVKPFNFALSSNESDIFLNSNLPTPQVSLIKSDDITVVKCKTIDLLVAQEGIVNVCFLKIDVEGYELEVLKGAKKLLQTSNAPILCIECNTSLDSVEILSIYSIFIFLKECNSAFMFYQLFKTSHVNSKLKKINSFEELNTRDNLYCFLPSHLTKVKMGELLGR